MSYHPKRAKRSGAALTIPLLLAALAVCLVLIFLPTSGREEPSSAASGQPSPSPAAEETGAQPSPSQQPELTPAPAVETPAPPSPDRSAAAAFDFTQPAPQSDPVEMDYFSDALFIGDSRTDGLRIYSGIKGADFYCYKGLNIFDMSKRQVVEMDGGKYTVVEALKRGPQYKKIYISLGVNELGYPGTDSFRTAFQNFLGEVKAAQPDAVIYLQNLVPVNPEICAQKNQPSYVNNDRVADFNGVFPQLAQEYRVVLLDMKTALSDENGILPADATVDGVHFTKAWYQKWLEYLMCHVVTPEAYQAGQAAQ